MKYAHVLHTAPQTRLDGVWIPSKYPHHHCPAQTRKDGPGIPRHLFPQLFSHAQPTLTFPLHRQLGQRKRYSGEDVDDYLLVDATLYTTAKDEVATG